MRVGHASAELPVPPGTPLGGYADRTEPTAGSLDPLSISAVSIRSADRHVVWLVGDLPCVNVDLAEGIRASVERSLPAAPAAVWTSATHTHSGPDTGCQPGGGTTPTYWRERIVSVATDVAREAVEQETSAILEFRRGQLHGVGGSRSGPLRRGEVPIDLISFPERSGRVRGVVCVLPVHSTVLDASNRYASGDLAAATRRALTAQLPVGAWAVVVTGAAGDISTRPHRRSQDAGECARLGSLVADAAAQLLTGPPEPLGPAPAAVSAAQTSVALTTRRHGAADLDRALTDAGAELDSARRDGDPATTRAAYTALQGVRLAQGHNALPPGLECRAGVLRLDGLVVVGIGAEPFLDIAGSIAARVAAPSTVVGYTGGYLGYLPTREAYRHADASYEVLASPVEPGSAERVVERITALVRAK